MTTNGILRSESGSWDLGGFKGIFCRWAMKFVKENGLSATYLPWFQQNANAAWSRRDSRGLMDQNWSVQTGTGSLYAWWCSAAVVLLQVCPPEVLLTPTPTPVATHPVQPRLQLRLQPQLRHRQPELSSTRMQIMAGLRAKYWRKVLIRWRSLMPRDVPMTGCLP